MKLSLATGLAVALPCIGIQDAQEPADAKIENTEPPYVELDYDKVERRIAKEPAYTAEPRYALFVFGPAGKTRVWTVLDKSAKDAPHYDVLYVDLDADGDITEDGERFETQYSERMARAGMAITFTIPKLKVPGTDWVHERFRISTVRKAGRKGIFFQIKWRGEVALSGGYGDIGSDVTIWSATAAKAPILRPNPRGPLSFATWGSKALVFRPGKATHLNVIAGNRGGGPDTLAVVDDEFIDLKKNELRVTVIAKNALGKEVRARSRISEHC